MRGFQNIQLLKGLERLLCGKAVPYLERSENICHISTAPKILIQFSLEDLSSEENSVQTKMQSSRMRTADLSTVCVVATTRCQSQGVFPSSRGQNDRHLWNITFPQLRLRAVTTQKDNGRAIQFVNLPSRLF